MTDRDRRRLVGCQTAVIDAVDRVLDQMAKFGSPMMVTDGVRTEAQQKKLYAQGRTTPGRIVTYADGVKKRSNHQSGRAIDCTFVVNGQPSWDESLPWELYGETAESEGFAWGGRWRTPDKPHIEMPKDTTGAVKA
jgi:peptidoglycan L-alanyl-D-glutamate endopeptidase CwlK